MVIISGLEFSFRGSVVDALTVVSPYFRFVYNAFGQAFSVPRAFTFNPAIAHS